MKYYNEGKCENKNRKERQSNFKGIYTMNKHN